jgi:hypothetical protein
MLKKILPHQSDFLSDSDVCPACRPKLVYLAATLPHAVFLTMESSPKRRKINHPSNEAVLGVSRLDRFHEPRSTFVLQTDELLKEVKLDYDKTFRDVEKLLVRLKDTINRIEPHDPLTVRLLTLRLVPKTLS